MKLLLHIDQTASIRRGADAPHSTETFELDPNVLPQDLRDFFADHLDLKTGDIHASIGGYIKYLTLVRPVTVESVIAALAAMKTARADYEANLAEEDRRRAENKRIETEAAFAAGPLPAYRYITRYNFDQSHSFVEGSSYTGKPSTNDLAVTSGSDLSFTTAILFRRFDWPYNADDTVLDRAKPVMEQLKAELATATSAAKARLDLAYQAEAAKRAARVAAYRAQLDAKAAEIGGIFLERHLAGYTVDAEIIARIVADTLAAYGLESLEASLGRENDDAWEKPLTDEQFLTLKEFRSRLPEGAVVTLRNAWNGEGGSDVTDDIIYVEATFLAGHIPVIARKDLGACPEV